MSFAPDPTSHHPEEFGPYVIYERLGLGGMATVHRAKKQGIAGFERGVALKRMLSHLSEDADFVQSFIREAKVASLLVHPNIAQIYDFGRINGVYYIAMEHVEGSDVRRLLRYANRNREAIPIGVVLSILMELCDALEYAHNFRDENGNHLNIVHRDVSPSNLIVAHTGHLKVIDFGIAKASTRSLHTESGQAKGKLGYMSPEAAMGNVLGPVSDVFSTGVVAHELLTAVPLFTAKTDFETMLRIREGEIDPPSRRNPSCPAELDQLVMAALSRDPRSRLQTAGAFRHHLDAIAQRYGIRVGAREVAEYIGRVARADASAPRTSRGRDTQSPYSNPAITPQAFAHLASGNVGTGTGMPQFEDNLDDWGDVPNPSSRLALPPELAMHAPGMSQRYPIPPLAVQTPGTGSIPPLAGAAMHASLPPAPTKSRTGLVVTLVALIVGVGAAIAYVAVIRPQQDTAPVAATPSHATLAFAIEPEGAIVEIGGKPVDAGSPAELDPGVYSVTIKKDGYVSSTTSLTLRAGDKQTINIALEKAEVASVAGGESAVPLPDAGDAAPDDAPEVAEPGKTTSIKRNPGGKRPRGTNVTNKGSNEPVDDEPENNQSEAGSASVTPPDPTPKPPDPIVKKPDPVPVKPIEPTKPKVTPVVAATAVTKLSGEIPAIKVKNTSDSVANVLTKVCIDTSGRVTEASVKKSTPEIASQLEAAVRSWRYKPYLDASKQPSPVCFGLQLKVVFKKAD